MFKPSVSLYRRVWRQSCRGASLCRTPCYWSILPNSLRVISEQTCSQLSCVALYVQAGARFEAPGCNGVTHLIERMALKGLLSMPRKEFEKRILEIGAKFTVKTTREYQVIQATCLYDATEEVMSLLARITHELDFSEIDAERANMLQEMVDSENDPKQVVFDYLHETAFQGTPLAQRVIGPSRNIEKFDKYYAKSYFCYQYQPSRMVLVGSGMFSHQQFVCMATNCFGGILQTECDYNYQPARFTGSSVVYRNDSMSHTHVAIAVEVPGYKSSDYFNVLAMKSLIGSWHKSQGTQYKNWPELAQASAVADLCESYETFYIPYVDVGLWGVYFVVTKGTDLDNMVVYLQECWKSLCCTMHSMDLQRAVNDINLQLAKRGEGAINSVQDMGLQMMYHCMRKQPGAMQTLASSVEVAGVRSAADRYIYDRCPAVAAIGAVETLPDYTRIRGGMNWLRL